MNSGRFILSQVLDLVHRQTLDRLVRRYEPTRGSGISDVDSNSSAWLSRR